VLKGDQRGRLPARAPVEGLLEAEGVGPALALELVADVGLGPAGEQLRDQGEVRAEQGQGVEESGSLGPRPSQGSGPGPGPAARPPPAVPKEVPHEGAGATGLGALQGRLGITIGYLLVVEH
jgi:hypothetical protein